MHNFRFLHIIMYKKQPCRMQNLNRSITILPPVSGLHALLLQDVMQLLLFSSDGCIPVNHEILPKTSFFFFFPAEVYRDISIG